MNIHQIYIGDDLELVLSSKSEEMKSFSDISGTNYKLWTDQEIVNLIKEHYPDNVLYAYNSLVPPAYKADLAKACIVNIFGGWYSDLGNTAIDHEYLINLKTEGCLFFTDLQEEYYLSQIDHRFAIQSGFFYSQPNSKIFKFIINKICKNVESRFYGSTPWDVSGPLVFGEAVAALQSNNDLLGNFSYDNAYLRRAYYLESKNPIALYQNVGLLSPFKVPGIDYFELWQSRKVYK